MSFTQIKPHSASIKYTVQLISDFSWVLKVCDFKNILLFQPSYLFLKTINSLQLCLGIR